MHSVQGQNPKQWRELSLAQQQQLLSIPGNSQPSLSASRFLRTESCDVILNQISLNSVLLSLVPNPPVRLNRDGLHTKVYGAMQDAGIDIIEVGFTTAELPSLIRTEVPKLAAECQYRANLCNDIEELFKRGRTGAGVMILTAWDKCNKVLGSRLTRGDPPKRLQGIMIYKLGDLDPDFDPLNHVGSKDTEKGIVYYLITRKHSVHGLGKGLMLLFLSKADQLGCDTFLNLGAETPPQFYLPFGFNMDGEKRMLRLFDSTQASS